MKPAPRLKVVKEDHSAIAEYRRLAEAYEAHAETIAAMEGILETRMRRHAEMAEELALAYFKANPSE